MADPSAPGDGVSAGNSALLGCVHGLFGVRGWLKLYSYTAPPQNLLDYSRRELRLNGQSQSVRVLASRTQGKTLVAHLAADPGEPIDDRDAAARWLGADIWVSQSHFPQLPQGEFYCAELLGFAVTNSDGAALGEVADFLETGATMVMVVRGDREYLIPFARGVYITNVDLAERVIAVDWDTTALDE